MHVLICLDILNYTIIYLSLFAMSSISKQYDNFSLMQLEAYLTKNLLSQLLLFVSVYVQILIENKTVLSTACAYFYLILLLTCCIYLNVFLCVGGCYSRILVLKLAPEIKTCKE